jgi:hypothetical protein
MTCTVILEMVKMEKYIQCTPDTNINTEGNDLHCHVRNGRNGTST